MAGRLTDMATMKGAQQRALRNLFLGTVGRSALFRHRLEMDLSGLRRRAAAELPDRRASRQSL